MLNEMNTSRLYHWLLIALTLSLSVSAATVSAAEKKAPSRGAGEGYPSMTPTNYHGWANS
jgi:hypothetical protein